MKIITQIGIILGVCLLGEALSILLPFAFPSSVISMLLLFLLLVTRVIKLQHIDELSDFFLNNMAFFFIPAGVGVIECFDVIQGKMLVLLLICFISTLLTFAVTSLTVSAVIRLQAKFTGKDQCGLSQTDTDVEPEVGKYE